MEFFFLVPWVHTEIIIFCIVTVIFIGALIWYYFPTFVRIFQKFGPKGRDARIDGRDSELLKEREKTEEQKFQEQIQSLENPILSGDETDTKLLLEEKEPGKTKKKHEKEIKKQNEKEGENKEITKKEKTEKKSKESQQTNNNKNEIEIKTVETQDTTEEKQPKKKEKNPTEELANIKKQAQTLIARGEIDEAQALIINGLALKKDHKKLNLMLGSIYEGKKKFDAAEILYKDLAKSYPEDAEILKSLADVLIIKKKYKVAAALYEKLLSLSEEKEEILFVLSHLSYELKDMENLYRFTRLYLKQWPKNKEILDLEAKAQIHLGKRKDAIETLIKLKTLSPYNTNEIQEMIEKLVAEEEMNQHFNAENS
ncbi:tetratricopeptide repeat protein [Candidatus Gracilibacteria bacterium]|nr:tetratricopeptide repeat protein [Candidatus Gracilibacteria bacterium]